MSARADYSDQRDIFDPDQFAWPVHIVGLGGIGGALLFPLMKLGVSELHLWDDDKVEPHNIPAQLVYRPSDIGLPKTEACCNFLIRQEAECKVVQHPERVDATTDLEGIVISGVDTMSSRQAIWDQVKFNSMVPFYMDGRIGGEQMQLLSLDPSDFDAINVYEHFLFPDSEGSPLPCAARTVIHPPTVLAGLMIAELTLFIRKEATPSLVDVHLKAMNFSTIKAVAERAKGNQHE
jgi:sulfur-carrier protein adenylyltransferase/sulfurtransferase